MTEMSLPPGLRGRQSPVALVHEHPGLSIEMRLDTEGSTCAHCGCRVEVVMVERRLEQFAILDLGGTDDAS